MKTTVHRMAFYLCKVSDYNGARFDILRGRPARKPPATRPSRLLLYKIALYKRIRSEAGVC
ncbi:hypothetical protein BK120_08200 [Paenibacillus sp. FSL A5-0031]|nr:hypothetical protein BK120_08200 [Paenibacillus sp. FSL A5-0031]